MKTMQNREFGHRELGYLKRRLSHIYYTREQYIDRDEYQRQIDDRVAVQKKISENLGEVRVLE